jgi:hypothetical protein
MDNIENFYRLQSTSTITQHLKNKISSAKEEDWIELLEMSCLLLSIDDFITETKLVKFINDMKCHEKIAIYRFAPNTCYKWHIDHPGRKCSINMLIEGYDSMTVFGEPARNGRFVNLSKLEYYPDSYVLLNVHKFHTVFNFSEHRYVLSIGIPATATYADVKQYIINNNI